MSHPGIRASLGSEHAAAALSDGQATRTAKGTKVAFARENQGDRPSDSFQGSGAGVRDPWRKAQSEMHLFAVGPLALIQRRGLRGPRGWCTIALAIRDTRSKRKSSEGWMGSDWKMPRMYRVMKRAEPEVKPEVGDTATKLGVRERDLPPRDGNAHPGEGGMSVVSCIAGFRRRMMRKLCSPKMVPKRLHDTGKIPGAIGSQSLHLFRHGEGSFEHSSVTEQLTLVPDGDDHATVQPSAVMVYADYRQALVNTRNDWVSGEDDPDE